MRKYHHHVDSEFVYPKLAAIALDGVWDALHKIVLQINDLRPGDSETIVEIEDRAFGIPGTFKLIPKAPGRPTCVIFRHDGDVCPNLPGQGHLPEQIQNVGTKGFMGAPEIARLSALIPKFLEIAKESAIQVALTRKSREELDNEE